MNAKAQEFINKMKAEQQAKELKEREKHLLSLGFIDEDRCKEEIVYSDVKGWNGEWKWDNEKKKYYKSEKVIVPIEVTDEEYQEILKYAPLVKEETHKEDVKPEPATTYANWIYNVARALFVINIIGGIILSVVFYFDYEYDEFVWVPLVSAISYCVIWYPILVGFSKIVKMVEKQL